MSNEILDAVEGDAGETIPGTEPEAVPILGTVAETYADGVTLILDGQTEAGEKHYKGNLSAALRAGDRVKLTKDSGTYMVDYALGVPGSRGIPSGGAAGQILAVDENGGYYWATPAMGVPTGGTTGQVLSKRSNADGDLGWTSLSFQDRVVNGSYNLVLSSTGALTSNAGAVSLGSAYSTLGFFGSPGSSKKSLYATSTLADVINVLKAYGLVY